MGDEVIVETVPDSLGDPGCGCNAGPVPAAGCTAAAVRRGPRFGPMAEPAGLTTTPQKSEPSGEPGHWSGGQEQATSGNPL